MAELLLKSLKPTLLEYIDKAGKAAPAVIAALIMKLSAWLPATIEKISAGLKGVAAKELPGIGTALTTGVTTASAWLKVKIAKL